MFTAILATAVVAAEPTRNLQDVFSTYDYPEAELRDDHGGTVGYRLLVSDKGMPTGCEVMYSTRWKALDIRSCAVLIVRARFKPALDSAGRAVPGIFSGRVTWSVPGRRTIGSTDAPDSDLTVNLASMPKGIRSPAVAVVAFAVDTKGSASDCTPMMPSDVRPKDLKSEQLIRDKLGRTACSQILQTLKFRPMSDEQGQPIVSIQTARVSFEAAAQR